MEVTTDFIKSSFDKFNKGYFNGALVTPAFEVSHCRGSYITEERFNELVNKYKLKVQENLSCSRKIAV